MKFFIVTAAVLLSTVLSHAQIVIEGLVESAETGEALPGASVFLGEKATITDGKGQFRFNLDDKGNYTIRISYIGFEPYEEQMSITGSRNIVIPLNPDVFMTDEVIVSSTRATMQTPTTFSTIDRQEIEENNLGQDLPYLLNLTPSLVTTSDAGAGVGYTGLRIRGTDASRINVTINGIPLNDSESHGVFWVDIPDIASSTESIQIQRGVGTSTNGAGAFGGTINLQTNAREQTPYGELINSYGSFNTWRHTLGFGTGMINDHWTFDGRLSKITSDGYIDRATSDLNSYYLAGGYYGKNTLVKALVFGGKERTYQSWYGTPEAVLENDPEGIEAVIANNGLNEAQAENMKNAGRTFNWYLYEDQVDDYQQDHYQLHLSQKITEELNGNVSFHYTYGRGFYEEYKYDDDFEDYNLPNVTVGTTTISSSDIIRERWLDNHFYGLTYSLEYADDWIDAILGGAYNQYKGDHFGEIIWAEYAVNAFKEHRYYDNNSFKTDFNTFLKVNYQISDQLNLFGDLQVRRITYDMEGIDSDLRNIDIYNEYNFLNPKLGATYQLNAASNIYASYSIANREPVRSDFIDSPQTPEHETLRNLEAGYRHRAEGYQLQANYYLMDYTNQLVLTGELNDSGSPLRTNVKDSYRMGIELQGQVMIGDYLRWAANATFSRNKIGSFREIIYDYGPGWDEFNVIENNYEDSDISFSPEVIAGSQLSYLPVKGVEISLLSKYVGRQYLDNTSNEDRAIDAYFINDVRLNLTANPGWLKEIGLTFQVNNIFDELYSSNGYTFGYMAGPNYIVRENYYYPQATRNYLLSLKAKF